MIKLCTAFGRTRTARPWSVVLAPSRSASKALTETFGNQRTLAAHAMLEHFHAEHSCEAQVRARAMVMERQGAPRYGSRTW